MLASKIPEELRELLIDLVDGQLGSDGVSRLDAILRASPDLQAFYDDFMTLHGMLLWRASPPLGAGPFFGEKTGFADKSSPDNMDLPPSDSPISPAASLPLGFLGSAWQGTTSYLSNHEFFTGYMVATVFFAIAAIFGLNVYVSTPAPQQYVSQMAEGPGTPPQLPPPTKEQEKFVSIARITGMVDCRWVNADDAPFHDRVVQGTKFMLKSGLLEITYYTGAKVILQGPCTYEVESTAGGFLSLGKLTARVESRSRLPGGTSRSRLPGGTSRSRLPDGTSRSRLPDGTLPTDSDTSKSRPAGSRPAGGTYFAVRTPTAVVTDLGTEFGVEVNGEGVTRSHVFRGKVELVALDDRGEKHGSEVVLNENESAQVEKDRRIDRQAVDARTVSSNLVAFVRRMPLLRQIPLGNLFDDPHGADLIKAVKSDTFQAVADENKLGVVRIAYGGSTIQAIANNNAIQVVLANVGWDERRDAQITNDAWDPTHGGGAIRTIGWPDTSNWKIEDGIGMCPNAMLTFDLAEIRTTGMLKQDQTFRFVVDRAGINDDLQARDAANVYLIVLICDADRVISGHINGKPAAIEKSADGLWRFTGNIPSPVRGADPFVSFDVPVPGNARYLTIISTGAGEGLDGNTISGDHAVFSGARLEVSSMIPPTTKTKGDETDKK